MTESQQLKFATDAAFAMDKGSLFGLVQGNGLQATKPHRGTIETIMEADEELRFHGSRDSSKPFLRNLQRNQVIRPLTLAKKAQP